MTSMAREEYQKDRQGQTVFKRDGSPSKKRGRKPGEGHLSQPYFPEKVETVRRMHALGKSFTEIGNHLGITRAGAYYIWQRWINFSYKG